MCLVRFAVLLEVKDHVGVRVRVRHPCEASHTVDSTYVQTGQAPVCRLVAVCSHSTGEMKLSKDWACTVRMAICYTVRWKLFVYSSRCREKLESPVDSC